MGAHRFLDGMIVALSNKNVYLELSYTLPFFQNSIFEKTIEFVIKKVGAHRVIYGSDHPEMSLKKTFERTKEILNKFDLTSRENELIFGGTIRSLINI